jgi:hypothetical protein
MQQTQQLTLQYSHLTHTIVVHGFKIHKRKQQITIILFILVHHTSKLNEK